MVLEAQIREEVSTEFMELFNKMEKDYRYDHVTNTHSAEGIYEGW